MTAARTIYGKSCCCCACPCDCIACITGSASFWRVSSTGWADFNGIPAHKFNGCFTLAPTAPCEWSAVVDAVSGLQIILVALLAGTPESMPGSTQTTWVVFFALPESTGGPVNITSSYFYTLPGSLFDCFGGGLFVAGCTSCGPALTQAVPPIPYAATPTPPLVRVLPNPIQWQVTSDGWSDANGKPSHLFNGTFTLNPGDAAHPSQWSAVVDKASGLRIVLKPLGPSDDPNLTDNFWVLFFALPAPGDAPPVIETSYYFTLPASSFNCGGTTQIFQSGCPGCTPPLGQPLPPVPYANTGPATVTLAPVSSPALPCNCCGCDYTVTARMTWDTTIAGPFMGLYAQEVGYPGVSYAFNPNGAGPPGPGTRPLLWSVTPPPAGSNIAEQDVVGRFSFVRPKGAAPGVFDPNFAATSTALKFWCNNGNPGPGPNPVPPTVAVSLQIKNNGKGSIWVYRLPNVITNVPTTETEIPAGNTANFDDIVTFIPDPGDGSGLSGPLPFTDLNLLPQIQVCCSRPCWACSPAGQLCCQLTVPCGTFQFPLVQTAFGTWQGLGSDAPPYHCLSLAPLYGFIVSVNDQACAFFGTAADVGNYPTRVTLQAVCLAPGCSEPVLGCTYEMEVLSNDIDCAGNVTITAVYTGFFAGPPNTVGGGTAFWDTCLDGPATILVTIFSSAGCAVSPVGDGNYCCANYGTDGSTVTLNVNQGACCDGTYTLTWNPDWPVVCGAIESFGAYVLQTGTIHVLEDCDYTPIDVNTFVWFCNGGIGYLQVSGSNCDSGGKIFKSLLCAPLVWTSSCPLFVSQFTVTGIGSGAMMAVAPPGLAGKHEGGSALLALPAPGETAQTVTAPAMPAPTTPALTTAVAKPDWRRRVRLPCVHLGEPTGETRECPTCTGKTHVPLMECAKHGTCTEKKLLPGVQCCVLCADYQAPPVIEINPD